MEPVKSGQVLVCSACGVELQVIKACDTTCACNIVCCEKPMQLKGQPETAATDRKRGCC